MKSLTSFFLGLIITVFSCLTYGQTAPVIKFREGSVWVTGLRAKTSPTNFTATAQAHWTNILSVYTHEAFEKKLSQSIAGTCTLQGDSLSFKPNFSFAAGQRFHVLFDYRAFLARSEGNYPKEIHTFELSFSIPKEVLSSTFIDVVHPQSDVLPENMLRMYLSFSAAMRPGEAYEHITLLREDGTPIEKAFLVIDQELWDAERKRFTLLFDPGRIKRGIQSQVDLGPPLQAGQTYRLVIDSAWRDAHRNPLAGSFIKSFTVTSAERTKLSIQHWKISAPTAGTNNDLLIAFDRSIDFVLALKYITITTAQGNRVRGNAAFTNSRYWRFTPDQPWPEGQFFIEVHPQLEDVSGNNFSNAFDIDLAKESRVSTSEIVRHSFYIKPVMK
jgi:hypothetical protein